MPSNSSAPYASLLWPDVEAHRRHTTVRRNELFSSDLNLDRIIQMLCIQPRHNKYVCAVLTDLCNDPDVLNFRLDIVDDLLRIPDLVDQMEDMLLSIGAFDPYADPQKQWRDNQLRQVIWRLSELRNYVECVTHLNDILTNVSSPLQSQGLCRLRDIVQSMAENETTLALRDELPDLLERFTEIRSISIGVNLDHELRPIDATLLSVNTYRYKQSGILQRFFNASDTDQEGIGPLHSVPRKLSSSPLAMIELADRDNPMMYPLFKDLSDVLNRISRAVGDALGKYARINTGFLVSLEIEIAFYLGMVRLIRHLRACGLPMCRPEVLPSAARTLELNDLYNINLALQMSETGAGDLSQDIVANDVECGDNGRIFILTGPNRGGKTTYIQALGLAQILFQAGCYVPASSARMSPVDGIYTHFTTEERADLNTGRLGEEAQRLSAIFAEATRHSLILLNESLASTSPGESLYLARDIVRALRVLGARAVYSTHLHELADNTDSINAETPGDSAVISIVAMVVPDETGADKARRTYKIKPGPPMGKSFAKEIASRYGISFEQLTHAMRARNAISDDS